MLRNEDSCLSLLNTNLILIRNCSQASGHETVFLICSLCLTSLALSALRLSVPLQSEGINRSNREDGRRQESVLCSVFPLGFCCPMTSEETKGHQDYFLLKWPPAALVVSLVVPVTMTDSTDFYWRINDCQGYKKMLEKLISFMQSILLSYIFLLGLTSIFDQRSKHTWVTWEDKKGQIPEKQEQKTREGGGGKKLVISL